MPVLAIISITSEWSQRTGLVTFTLEPRRLRVVWAKFVAVLILAVATLVLAIVLGAIGTLIGAAITGDDPVWNLDGTCSFDWSVLQQHRRTSRSAFAFATLVFLNTPAAIAVYYVVSLILPIAVDGIL